MKWINMETAAELLGVSTSTLYRHESVDGKWCTIFGQKIRVYRVGIHMHPHRRYNEAEIRRALVAIQAERERKANRRPWWAL